MQKKDYIIQLLKYIIMAIVVGIAAIAFTIAYGVVGIIVGTIDALFG